MERIASFSVDHTTLKPGMYVSRVDCGDIITYDIRMVRPNNGTYLSTGAAHTLEHLFATFARNSEVSENVVYVGPMGCRTGFYLICKALPHEAAIRLTQEAMQFIASYEGEIPGATEPECGNYQDMDLPAARQWASSTAEVLKGYTPAQLAY